MPTLRFESVVARPIAAVWAAFQDVNGLLPALTPPAQDLKVVSAAPLPQAVGTTVTLDMNGPLGRVQWVARYTVFEPPHATVTGVEARFVDEQVAGPFKRFTQSHEFEAATDRTTRCVDVIDYALPLGVLGSVANLAVGPMIGRTFAYRHRKMAELFGKA